MTNESAPDGDKSDAGERADTRGLRLRLYIALRERLRLPTGARFALYWHLASTVAGFVLAALLVLIDPFDVDRAISAQGRSIFYKIASYAYPREQTRALVVALDEAFLQSADHQGNPRSWPASYRDHRNAIRTMGSNGAAAIFVDFLFLDQRPDDDIGDFVLQLRETANEIPIFLAAPSEGLRARPEIEDAVNEHPNIYFVSVGNGRDLGEGHGYPMTPVPPGENVASEDELTPAALALARVHCGGMCSSRNDGAEMDIWWAAPRRSNPKLASHPNCAEGAWQEVCTRLPRGVEERAFHVLTAAVMQPFPQNVRPLTDPIPVPYVPRIRLGDVLDPNWDGLQDRMRGAIVFYGAEIDFVGDVQENPVNGQLPGVFTHAMAYDNLVAVKNYIQTDPPFGWSSKTHVIVLIGVLALLSFCARVYVTLRWPQAFSPRIILHDPERRMRRLGALDASVFIVGALVIAVFEFSVGRIGPGAWAPVLVAVVAGDFLSSRPLTAPVLGRISGFSRLLGDAGRRAQQRRKREKRRERAERDVR